MISKQQPTLLLACLALLAADLAAAEQNQLEEIVVTARKRAENLQELPMSVTAINAATIERLGIRNLDDITRYSPGVNLDNGFGLNDQRLVIRGLSPSRGRPNSAILVDGIDLTTESVSTAGGSMLFNQRLLDIAQVQVVKGPQSALYGRAAFSGAIQYVTIDPGDELETEVGVDIGDYGRRYVRGAVGGPVTDTLGLRLNGLSWNEDGYYDERFTGASLGGGDGFGLSLTAVWQPAESFRARARVAYSEDDFDQQATLYDPINTFIKPPASAQVLPNINAETIVGLFAGSTGNAGNRRPQLTPDPANGQAYPGGEQDVLNTSLRLDWDFAAGTITSYTGYASGDSGQVLDGDFDTRADANFSGDIARGGTVIDFATDTRMFSQEIRYASSFAGPLQFTAGALYWDEKVRQTENSLTALGFPFGPDGADEGYFNLVAPIAQRLPNYVDRDTKSSSLFGLVEWNLNTEWKLSAEARYGREEMRVRGSGCDPAQELAVFRCGFSTPDLASEFPIGSGTYTQLQRIYAVDSTAYNFFAPKAILEWSPTDDLLTYFSVSQGVKPGGISTVASGTWMDQEPDGDLDELKFDDEKLTAWELGAKSAWLNRRLTLNGALFFQQYTDKQIPVQSINGGFPAQSIDNAGKAEVFGIELEAVWLVTDHVRAQLGYAYLDAEYTRLVYPTNSGNSIARAGNCIPNSANNVCSIDLSGNTMEDVPEHSLVAIVGYYPPLGGSGITGVLEADAQYQDSRFVDEFNDRKLDSYTLVNLRAGLETERWDAILFVNNALDNDTIRSWSQGLGLVATAERTDPNLFAFPGDGFAIAPPPRQVGVRASLRF